MLFQCGLFFRSMELKYKKSDEFVIHQIQNVITPRAREDEWSQREKLVGLFVRKYT